MKTIYLFTFLALALSFTACLEEESDIVIEREFELPEQPGQQPITDNLERVDATQLQGAGYGMGYIEYRNAAGQMASQSMPGCVLSVLQTECETNDAECLAMIEEAGQSLSFGNDVSLDQNDNAQNTISFRLIDELTPTAGTMAADWLLTNVYPIIGGEYPFAVYRNGSELVLQCSDCPVEYLGNTFTERTIRLQLD
ncbi:hypothetical protein CEQ90_18415 [Lewinellaceae bacterium SD302]|nr:hypothetical protein CEQ90_18415 [Lewinellaceae bacterium SD302]